jgi:hypothetical protein
MEDGSLGLAGVNGSTLHLWSRKVNPEGVARWVQCRAIALDKVLPIDNPNHRANVMGFAEGVGVVMVRADASTFMLELKSGQVKKVSMPRYFVDVLPFISFYIPGTYVIGSSEVCLFTYMVLHFTAFVLLFCCVNI